MKKTLFMLAILLVAAGCIPARAASDFQQMELVRRYVTIDENLWDELSSHNKPLIDADLLEKVRGVYFRILLDAETRAKEKNTKRDIPREAYIYANLSDYLSNRLKKKADLRFQLAKEYMEDRRINTALDICNIIRIQEPKNVEVAIFQGDLFIQLNMLNEAMDIYRDILKLDKKNETALYRLGLFYNTLGRNKEAADMFRTLLKINPNYELARRFVDLYDGKIKGQMDKNVNELAVQHFMTAEKLFNAGKYQEAAEEYSKAIEADPKFGKAYAYLGECLTRLKKYPEAISVLENAVNVSPRDPEGFHFLGLALEKYFNFSQDPNLLKRAVESYEKAVQASPSYDKVKEDLERAKKRLEETGRKSG